MDEHDRQLVELQFWQMWVEVSAKVDVGQSGAATQEELAGIRKDSKGPEVVQEVQVMVELVHTMHRW